MEMEVKVLNQAALSQLRSNLGPAARRRVLTAISKRLKRMTQENFGVSGPYRPEEWPPYANDYKRWNKFEGEPATLIRTGKLINSIYATVTDNYAEVGSDLDYAAAQQFGTGTLPPRPYLPIRGTKSGFRLIPEAREEILQLASDLIIEEFKK